MPKGIRCQANTLLQALTGESRVTRTDGVMPMAAAEGIARTIEVPAAKCIQALADAGLIEVRPEGIFIPKYGKWQSTAEEIDDLISKRAEAGRKGGLSSGRSK